MEEDWHPFPNWKDRVIPASFAFGYPPKMPVQVSAWAPKERRDTLGSVSAESVGQPHKSLLKSILSVATVWEGPEFSSHLPACSVRLDHGKVIRNQLEIPGSWLGHCHFIVTWAVVRRCEVTSESPDVDKTQPQPWVGPSWIVAVTQKVT